MDRYREKYLRDIWPVVTAGLEVSSSIQSSLFRLSLIIDIMIQKHGIASELNLVEGSMTVKTTRKTKDPYVILKARDLIKLLARSIPIQQVELSAVHLIINNYT